MTDTSVAAIVTVAAEATPPSFSEDANEFSIAESMVSYLRKEAALADQKAKRLRLQAAELAVKFGITNDIQETYELDPIELAPLDEKGQPKYKGKKRGRKPKARQRKRKVGSPKRKHTGYTLFMQETYAGTKAANPELPSTGVISLVAKQWKELAVERKTEWKERAQHLEIDEHDMNNITDKEGKNSGSETLRGGGDIAGGRTITGNKPNNESSPEGKTDSEKDANDNGVE
jgi:hypothetical protein